MPRLCLVKQPANQGSLFLIIETPPGHKTKKFMEQMMADTIYFLDVRHVLNVTYVNS